MRNLRYRNTTARPPGARAAHHPFRQRWLHRSLVVAAASIVALAPASVSAQVADCVDGVTDRGSLEETWTLHNRVTPPAFSGFLNVKIPGKKVKTSRVSLFVLPRQLRLSTNRAFQFCDPRKFVFYGIPLGHSTATPSECGAAIWSASTNGGGLGVCVTFLNESSEPTNVWDDVSCATLRCAPACEPPTTGDTEPPVVTCPPNLVGDDAIPYNFYDYPEILNPADPACVVTGGVPAPGSPSEFVSAFGGSVSDNVTAPENLSMCISDSVILSEDGETPTSCPVEIERTYTFTDEAGNTSEPCTQTIHVNNLFAPDAIVWHQPLARKGMSEDTDPSDGDTLKYRFKLGQTIPIKVHALGCDGDITANSNVIGTVKVYGDVDDEWVEAGDVLDYNGVGGGGGAMDKVDGHLRYNLDTKTLREISDTNCYRLEVTVTDESTGESEIEILSLQAK